MNGPYFLLEGGVVPDRGDPHVSLSAHRNSPEICLATAKLLWFEVNYVFTVIAVRGGDHPAVVDDSGAAKERRLVGRLIHNSLCRQEDLIVSRAQVKIIIEP